ncbi:MAG: hypothetical protein DWG76_02575 [Chloroflexi bacterium]|nr:hypothetical protein [Chloroflexota bacterium]
MNNSSNWKPILFAIGFLLVAIWADRARGLLEDWAGATFQFQRVLLGALGLTLLFGLATVIFVRAIFGGVRADGWVFGVLALLGMLSFSSFFFAFVAPVGDALWWLPSGIVRSLGFLPNSYVGKAGAILFWTGLGGFVWRRKADS